MGVTGFTGFVWFTVFVGFVVVLGFIKKGRFTVPESGPLLPVKGF